MNIDLQYQWVENNRLCIFWLLKTCHFLCNTNVAHFCGRMEIFQKLCLEVKRGCLKIVIVSTHTSIRCELRILDFFQNPHFFPKKWVINIYCTCQKYNSLRKYHSRMIKYDHIHSQKINEPLTHIFLRSP